MGIPLGWAQESTAAPPKAPPSLLYPGGAILFFPDKSPRPSNDRFPVEAGQEVEVCILLETTKSPLLDRIVKNTTGFRLILEDNKVPPDAILVERERKKARIKPDDQGCYRTTFRIPTYTDTGIYQVADLLFKVSGRGYISVHQLLFGFSQADELEVSNPDTDAKEPTLIAIGTLQEDLKTIGKAFDFLKIKVKQEFTFNDPESGLEPKTLRVFYQLLDNGERTGIHEAKCRTYFLKKAKFVCQLEITRPNYEWELGRLALVLESIYLKDKAGNMLVLQDPDLFKKAAGDTPVKFEFRDKDPGVPRKNRFRNRHPNRLRSPST